jgi:hypothetical protein
MNRAAMVGTPYHNVCPASFFIPLNVTGYLNKNNRKSTGLFILYICLMKIIGMKRLSFLLGLLICGLVVMGQARSSQGIAEYQKQKLPAAVIELPYAPSTVEAALEKHFSRVGTKPSNSKDYKVYRNVLLGAERYDAYIKVERKSRKEKEASVVYMVVTRPNEIITSKAAGDQHGLGDAREFLNEVVPEVEDYQLDLDILAQEEAIDSTDLAKRRQQIEEKIADNSAALQTQQAELEKERQALEAVKSRRRKG